MSRLTFAAASLAVVAAQTWYGISPDTTIPGRVNLFAMTATGVPTKGAAAVDTSDYEYPKVDTLHCSYTTPMCYFATGIGGNGIQDYIYGVNRATGVTVFKHELPAGLYIDNLSFDWVNEELWAIAFDPNAPGGATATLASWSPVTGNLTSRTDVSAALRGGFVYGGAFSMCATTRQIYVGIDANQGGFNDRAAQFDVSGATPRLVGEIPLYFPVPSGFRAVCNASGLIALLANTIQADSEARETMLIGNVVETEQRAGLFIPIARGDLPAFNQNGQVALFLNGMFAEFNGQVLIPVYPPYTRGSRGPPGGFLWTVSPFVPGPTPPGALTPLNYYLAGAAGVPTV